MFFTKKQRNVLEFIRHYILSQGVAPTLDEMAEHFRVSRITIHEHVGALERKGALRRAKNRARAIEISEEADAAASVILPILGRVEAGMPSLPFEVPEQFDLQSWLRNPGDYHLLRVHGDSMIEDHISEGDLVLVDRRKQPVNGDIVVASTEDGGVTLKRIYREQGRVRLQPSNAMMEPIYVESADVRGVVIGLIRHY